jgi:hypothetical protein
LCSGLALILSETYVVYGLSPNREVSVRIRPYLQGMQRKEIHTPRFKRISRVIVLLFILALVAVPSILHSYSGIGISPVTTKNTDPAAEIGDAFITRHKVASELKVGDIVTFRDQASGHFISHRILDVVQQGSVVNISAQGNGASASASQSFSAEARADVAVTVTTVKGLGYAISYLSSTQGKQLSLTLMVVGNVIALFLFLFRKKIKTGISNAEKVFRSLYADQLDSCKHEAQRANTYRDLYEQTYKELELLRRQ